MAKNLKYYQGERLSVATTAPATPASGDPVRLGAWTGVAEDAKGDGGNAAGNTSVNFGPSVWNLSVKGADDSGNTAIAIGDPVFYVDGDTPPLSAKKSGYFLGFAQTAVNSGATTTTQVALRPSSVAGTPNIGNRAVTAAKLTSTMATGTVALPLTQARILATNAYQNLAATGGILATDSNPSLGRVNGATDPSSRVTWAATHVEELQWEFVWPDDLDNTVAATIHIQAGMAGATDVPTLTVKQFNGVGGVNQGAATAALSNAQADITLPIATPGTAGQKGMLSITPGAHGTDALRLDSVRISYARK